MNRYKRTDAKGFIREVVHVTMVAEKFHGSTYANQQAVIVTQSTSTGIKTGEDEGVNLRIWEVTTLSPGSLEAWSTDIKVKEGNTI